MTQWFVYKWGKPTWQKPHRVILRSPLPRIHDYHNKQLQIKEFQYLLPTYSWTLTPILNWTCFVVVISHFQCTTPSTWLTNCADFNMRLQSPTREGCWLQNSLVHHMMKIKKLLGHKTLRCTNTIASSIEDELGQILSPVTIGMNTTLLHTRATFDDPQNNPYICLGLWEKKAQTCIYRLDWNQLWKTKFHKPR